MSLSVIFIFIYQEKQWINILKKTHLQNKVISYICLWFQFEVLDFVMLYVILKNVWIKEYK